MIRFPSWFDRRIVAYQVAAFLIMLVFTFQFYVVFYSHIDNDELEHLHASWLVSKGNLPFRDFFEHHTPAFWYMLSPLFREFSDTLGIIPATRALMFVFSLLLLLVSYLIAREYFSKNISLLVVLAVLYEYDYIISAVIVRPELTATLLWLSAFYVFLKSGGRSQYLLVSGLFIGLAFAYKQTAFFFLIALIVSVVVQNHSRREIYINTAFIVSGFIIPVLILFLFFYLNNALNEFIYGVFLFNMEHNAGNLPLRTAKVFSGFLNDIPFWAFGLAGVIAATESLLKKRLPENETPLLVSIYIVLLSLIPSNVMWYYRFLPLIPLVAVYTVYVIKIVVVDKGLMYLRGPLEDKLIIYVFLLMILFGLMHPLFFLVSWKIENYGVIQLMYENRTEQDEIMEFLWQVTSPGDSVFDGYGVYIYRNHGYRYWFLHPALFDFNMSSLDDVVEYLNETRPRVIIYDHRVEQLSNEAQSFIRRHYVPTGRYAVYVVGATLDGGDLQDGNGSFYLLSSGDYDISYDILPAGTHEIYIDNELAGDTLYLSRGRHRIHVDDHSIYVYNITIRHHYTIQKPI